MLFEDYELWLRCVKKDIGIFNINKALVAMRRSNYLSNRIGLKYAIYEFKFLIETIKQNTIKKIYIPFFLIRILLRVLPENFSSFLRSFDSSRLVSKKEYNLDDYILEVINNKNSLYRKYYKLIKK